MKVTKHEIEYTSSPYPRVHVIPSGTPVMAANNLPGCCYWVTPWKTMTEYSKYWERNYGFLVQESEVCEIGDNE